MTDPTRCLVKKIAEVMKLVGGVPKRGFNKHFGYSFQTEPDILDAVRDELAKRHVILVPSVESFEIRDVKTKNGEDRLTSVLMRFTAMDGESGESFTFGMLGQGQDPGDKGAYKAETGAEKYAVKKLLMLGDHEADPEADARTDESHAKKSPPPKPTTPTVAQVQKLASALGDYGVTIAMVEARLGHVLATMTLPEYESLRAWGAELKAKAKPKTPDEIAQDAVKAQAEAAFASAEKSLASPVAKPSTVEANATFKALVEKIHAAPDEQTARNVHAEGIYLKLGKGDMAALLRAVEDRIFVLKTLAEKPAAPRTDDLTF